MSQKAMKYLNDKRIVYRRYSPDEPTEEYNWGWYYADGTYGYYSLFHSKSMITSYKSLKWHLLTLWYLNPQLSFKEFTDVSEFIAHKPNGFITFEIPKNRLKAMLSSILLEDLDRPPRNRLRKIVFKDGTGLDTSEKLSIVGSIIGRGKAITKEDIYDTMLHINDNGDKITISKIAKYLKCTPRTIHRHMCDDLRNEKEKLNINNEKI
jgi:hypothetical protein|tara:strand:+ start:159 stop:782 length:624 start_codon:yes stop_codon:yes gene_type:complete